MFKISILSDTHTKHGLISPSDLPGGDLLVFAGDLMNSGYNVNDIKDFCHWFNSLKQYETKIFIAGNHDRMFEDHPKKALEIVNSYKDIDYLQDEEMCLYFDGPNGDFSNDNVHIYGSPWQPAFHNWAFNLPKNSYELESKWALIPNNTNILVTHGPSYGMLDTVLGCPDDNLGCNLLSDKIKQVKPQIHICGHIHSGRGYKSHEGTHYFNASVLDEKYRYTQKPFHIEWDKEKNTVNFRD